MEKPAFIRLLNADPHTGEMALYLLAPVQIIEMHWDTSGPGPGRSRMCAVQLYKLQGIEAPISICRWCDLEQGSTGGFFAPIIAALKGPDGERKRMAAIVQMPLQFIAEAGDRLRPGREIRVWDLAVKDKRARWQLGKMCDPANLPASFDLIPVLMRIKGMDKLPEIPTAAAERPDVIPFRKQA